MATTRMREERRRSSMKLTSSRVLAAHVLVRVQRDRAFASAALEAELSRAVQIDPRDRALATELVYGTLRIAPWLEREIERFAPRGMAKLDPSVRAHLLVAAYQLAFTRVPAFAAVNEAVEAIRESRGARLAAFANAVLRKLADRVSQLGESDREDALLASIPAWLREALARALSPEGAREFLRSGMAPPPVALRVADASAREEWLKRFAAAAPDGRFEAGALSPLAILARGAGKPQDLPGAREGCWAIQEEGSQIAALAVGASPGDLVLDACAGRGNKTAVLARAVGERGAVDACDSMPAKLDRLREELAAQGLAARATFAVDWREGSGDVSDHYDRVLVDAPCSGVGTLRRRPEVTLRREPADLEAMARAQIAIASRVAEHVRPGGSLVYVVCSVLREEAEDVVERLLHARSDLTLAPFDAPAARAVAGERSSFRLLPHVHGTDGYFVARFEKRPG